jgi:hypothetical protein
LVDELQPVAPLRQANGMVRAAIALLAGAGGMVALFGMRSDFLAGQPNGMVLVSAGLFLMLALASAWAVVDMARPHVGSRREGWAWNAAMVAVLPLAALALMAGNWMHGVDSGLHNDGRVCMEYGLLWGLLTSAALILWLRRGAPAQPNRAGLLTGVAAGSAGIFAVSLFCPHSDMVHIGIWHGLTVALAGGIGRFAVPPLVRW